MKQKFIEENYEVVNFDEFADVYVVNTCTVTNMSDRKSRQIIRRAKEINKNSVLVVTGCYAQVAKEEVEQIEGVDIVIGNQEKRDIISYVKEKQLNKQEGISNILYEKNFAEFGSTTYTDKTRAVVKIQDGCNRFCSYCIIPYARGGIRSRNPEEVVSEIKEIAKNGIKEVVITGIHLASYGKECEPNISLLELLKKINEIDGIKRIRLGSLEPTLMQKDFIEELSKLEKVCNHFHLSLQSGCDETLKRMNRRYTAEEFESGINIIKEYYPNVSLTTDIIVGFPGETNEEFETTYKFVKNINFYKMHVFKYSKRKGTKAAIMPYQISGEVKEERSRKLIELSNYNQKRHNEEYIGKEIEVLFEEKDGEYLKGHSTNYIMVYVKTADTSLENEIATVKITR
jgi:threonylcarbamoyladenosine tRNA methylthiotransferase MtaB